MGSLYVTSRSELGSIHSSCNFFKQIFRLLCNIVPEFGDSGSLGIIRGRMIAMRYSLLLPLLDIIQSAMYYATAC